MDDNLRDSLLKSIELSGGIEVETSPVKILINEGLQNVIDLSSGRKRIKPIRAGQFSLILSQPSSLLSISPLEIRCLNCKRVISYPSWWLELRFDKNTFHYFVCFSEVSPNRVSLDCSKRR